MTTPVMRSRAFSGHSETSHGDECRQVDTGRGGRRPFLGAMRNTLSATLRIRSPHRTLASSRAAPARTTPAEQAAAHLRRLLQEHRHDHSTVTRPAAAASAPVVALPLVGRPRRPHQGARARRRSRARRRRDRRPRPVRAWSTRRTDQRALRRRHRSRSTTSGRSTRPAESNFLRRELLLTHRPARRRRCRRRSPPPTPSSTSTSPPTPAHRHDRSRRGASTASPPPSPSGAPSRDVELIPLAAERQQRPDLRWRRGPLDEGDAFDEARSETLRRAEGDRGGGGPARVVDRAPQAPYESQRHAVDRR